MEEHIASCEPCRQELATLQPIVDSFVAWPVDVLRPSASLWDQLVDRIAAETNGSPPSATAPQWSEPEWEDIA